MPRKKKTTTKKPPECKSKSFDKVIPETPRNAQSGKNSISYVSQSGVTAVITLRNKNKYHLALFLATQSGVQSDWFNELATITKRSYFSGINLFFQWINESAYKATSKTRYSILKDYESYKINDGGQKTTPITHIRKILSEGAYNPALSKSDYDYLQKLLELSKPKPNPPTNPPTLSSWFDAPWLRPILGESEYLKLESPRLLFNSFRVTIASTLNYLLEQRECRQNSPSIEFNLRKKGWQYKWNRLVLDQHGAYDKNGEPVNDLSALLLLDLVVPKAQDAMKNRLARSGTGRLPIAIYRPDKNIYPWQRPVLFRPEHQHNYSPLEELLCAWLAACECIQPSDISKLTVNNYAYEYNKTGRLTIMQCNYYKGRSGRFQKSAVLMGNDIWTKTLYRYIQGLNDKSLFHTDISAQRHLVFESSDNSDINLLFKIWKLPNFQNQLDSQLKSAETSRLFLDSILAMENGDAYYNSDYSRNKVPSQIYRAKVQRPLPRDIFSLTHIKTTSVHARSDIYRDSDLINHNSHSSPTEKASYLTDENKEWVDQAGRITRLVLNDLKNVVYNPSITAIEQSVKEQSLRTKITQATGDSDVTTHSLVGLHTSRTNDHEILVLDTLDSALYFVHYLAQAKSIIKKLVEVRPDWVEKNMIVQVEWTHQTLARMKSAAAARKVYPEYAPHLPPLFDYLLETTE